MLFRSILKEIGNIGAGNATTAVATMLNLTLEMKVPKVELIAVEDLGSAIGPEEQTIVGIFLEVKQDISGSIMFLMELEPAHYLVDRLMGVMGGVGGSKGADFSDMELSALKEIGNIIAGAYLSALSSMTNLVILPSIPYISVDMAAAILSVPAIQFGQYGDNALMIQTKFGADRMIDG